MRWEVWALPGSETWRTVAGAGLCGKGQAYRFAQRAACMQMVLPGGLYLAFMLVKQKALLTSWEAAAASG